MYIYIHVYICVCVCVCDIDRQMVIYNKKQGFLLKLLKLKMYWSCNEICSNVVLLRKDCFGRKFSYQYPEKL